MADRSVTARLRLVYADFTKGTTAAAQGLKGIGDQAKKTSTSVGRDWGQIGRSVSDLGKSMTTRLTLPIVGLGALAVKAAGDFDAAFTNMRTLAGVSADEVAGLKDEVLGLAGETGKAPVELANALYFLSSSGLEGAAALDALEISAKASAAGLGSTEVLADAVSSAMLGFAKTGLTASEAMDTLIATAQAGKAEPAELAAQMGRLIPTAAALGITFQDVGGAIAALSTAGFDAAGGTTVLSNVMSKLLKPSQQAEEQLDAVGLSTQSLRDLIAEKGLLGTLEVLKERLGENGLPKFFEDAQAVQGALALLGGDMDKTRDIFDQVNDSAGATEKAFETWAESMGAKNARAFADFQVALIKLGDAIAPIASDVMSFVAAIASGFGDLPGPVQKLVVAFAGLLAAAGPLITVGGKLISAWSAVMKTFSNLTSAGGQAFADAMNAGTESTNNLSNKMGGLKTAAGLAAGAAGIGAVLFAIDEMGKAAARARTADLVEEFTATKDAAETLAPAVDGSAQAMGQMSRTFDALLEQNPVLAQQYLDQAEALGLNKDMVESAQAAIDQKKDAEVNAAVAAEENQASVEGATEAMADQEMAVNEAAEAFKAYADSVRAAVDPVFGLLNSLRQNDQAQRDVRESLAALNEVRADSEATAAEVTAAEVAYQDALINVGTTAADVTSAAANLNAAVAENPALLEDALGALQTWRDQGLIPTDAQLQFLQEQLRRTGLEGAALGEVDPQVDVTERGVPRTRAQLRSVKDAATGIPPRRNTHVSASGTSAAVSAIGSVLSALNRVPQFKTTTLRLQRQGFTTSGLQMHSGGVVPGRRGEEVAAVLQAGERVLSLDDPVNKAMSGPMASAAALGGGGGGDTLVFNFPNLIHPDSRQFTKMVVKAVNTAQRKGRGLNAA